MPLDTAAIAVQRAWFLGGLSARQDAACFGRFAIAVTQFPDRRRLACLLFFGGWIAALRDFAKDAAAFRSRHIRSPRRAMAADRVPALATVGKPIF